LGLVHEPALPLRPATGRDRARSPAVRISEHLARGDLLGAGTLSNSTGACAASGAGRSREGR
jgi:hypothetical protein